MSSGLCAGRMCDRRYRRVARRVVDVGWPMSNLTDAELHALQHLAEKKAGGEVPFINIAAARALSELGLATRSREGWDITAEGSALLARLAAPPA